MSGPPKRNLLRFTPRQIISAWAVFLAVVVLRVWYATNRDGYPNLTLDLQILLIAFGLATKVLAAWLFFGGMARTAARMEIEQTAQTIANFVRQGSGKLRVIGPTLCYTRGYNSETTDKVIKRAEEIVSRDLPAAPH